MHMVHQLIDGPEDLLVNQFPNTLAVIGIMFQLADESHPFLNTLRIEDLGVIENTNPADLFTEYMAGNNQVGFYHY